MPNFKVTITKTSDGFAYSLIIEGASNTYHGYEGDSVGDGKPFYDEPLTSLGAVYRAIAKHLELYSLGYTK